MRFSKSWIDEWVDTGLDADQLSDIITMAGLEVDTVEKVAGDFDHVVIGQVVECADHPNSDHLHVTKVDVGSGELLDIVCGAPNCRKGLKVCVSMIGAHLPGGIEIKPTKLRGEPSNGMLCSFKELGVDLPSNGIIELPEDAPLGTDIREYFGWNDRAVEVDLTANRADCLSIVGLAREIAVLTGKQYKMPEFTRAAATLKDTFPIKIHDYSACPKYYGRIFRGLNVKAATPVWMQEKLRKCGLRSVDPIVDVTNYVMLELGQPLHSFDLDKLKGSLNVRFAQKGEKIVLLSGQEAELTPDTLVIADENGPLMFCSNVHILHLTPLREEPVNTDLPPMHPTASNAVLTTISRNLPAKEPPSCCWKSAAVKPVKLSGLSLQKVYLNRIPSVCR